MLIHLGWAIILTWFSGRAGVSASCFRVKERLDVGHVASLSLGHTERQTTTHTLTGTENLASSPSESFLIGRQTFNLQRTHTNEERPTLKQQRPHSASCVVFLKKLQLKQLNHLQLWVEDFPHAYELSFNMSFSGK